MSVIAFDGKMLACDMMVTSGDISYKHNKMRTFSDPKIFSEFVFAFVGCTTRASQLIERIQYDLKYNADTFSKDFSIEHVNFSDLGDDNENSATVVCWDIQRNEAFVFYNTLKVCEKIKGVEALGSGQAFALTALKCGLSPMEAVMKTNELCITCGKGVQYYTPNDGVIKTLEEIVTYE